MIYIVSHVYWYIADITAFIQHQLLLFVEATVKEVVKYGWIIFFVMEENVVLLIVLETLLEVITVSIAKTLELSVLLFSSLDQVCSIL